MLPGGGGAKLGSSRSSNGALPCRLQIQDHCAASAARRTRWSKELRRAFQKSELTPDGHCPLEGVRSLEEAIRSGLRSKAVFFSESAASRAEALVPQLSKHTEKILLPDKVFQSAVPTETPQGVAALVKVRVFHLHDALEQTREAPC